MTEPAPYRSFRAPAESGKSFCWPARSEWMQAIEVNRTRLSLSNRFLNGRSIQELRVKSRLDLVHLAHAYRQEVFHDQSATIPDASTLILGGHQPELYHPGVWYKNYLLSDSARKWNVTAINLIVDQDLCRSLSVRVPVRDGDGTWRIHSMAIEGLEQATPWETLFPRDWAAWESLPRRLHAVFQLSGSSKGTVLDAMWPNVIDALKEGRAVGEAIAFGRHQLERSMGLSTWEIPLSRLCRIESFACFFFELALHAKSFADIYNQCRDEYRRHHRIRNQAHPVPSLEPRNDWLELPFWIYSRRECQRRPLYCKESQSSQGKSLLFTDHEGFEVLLAVDAIEKDPVACMDRLHEAGYAIRTRALTTTLFARLLLSDFFVHGIGGGKYDQVTDQMIRRWLGVEPPIYAVATATVSLPLEAPNTSFPTESELRSRWWHDRYHLEEHEAERLSPADPNAVRRFIEEKRVLLRNIPPKGAKRSWHERMHQINHSLATYAQPLLDELLEQIPRGEQYQRQMRIVRSREYSIALFETDKIRQTLQHLAEEES